MHVLTKIFIVLVALLAVLLVPLVVVYAHNENSFQARFQALEAQAIADRASFESAKAGLQSALTQRDQQITELEAAATSIREIADQREVEVRSLQSDLESAKQLDVQIQARLTTLASALDTSQQLIDQLIGELRDLRREALTSERQKVELDEALRDALAKLDAAVEARKALQEELQRLKDEYAKALSDLGQYVAAHGTLEAGTAAGEGVGGRPVDVDVDATVIAVRRSADQIYAEIDAGSRDGVKEGWVMTVGHGGTFIARLRVISVDINRSTGIVEYEDENGRGRVEVGHRAFARIRR